MSRHVVPLLCLTVALCLAGCKPALDGEPDPTGIRGTLFVVDASGNRFPAAGAQVSLENGPVAVKADDMGRFVLQGLPFGVYDLSIAWKPAPGSLRDQTGLRIRNIELSEKADGIDLGTLDLGGLGAVRGVVLGAPTSKLTAVIEGVARTVVQEGAFAFEALAAGAYEVALVGESGVWSGGTVTVKPRETTDIEIDADVAPMTDGRVNGQLLLSDVASLSGRVFSADGGALSKLVVFLAGADRVTDVVDGEGRWSLEGIPAGVYTLVVQAAGMFTTQLPYVVIAGAGVVPDLVLVPMSAGCALGGSEVGEEGDADGDGVPDVDEPVVCLCHPGHVDANEDGACDDPNDDMPECVEHEDCGSDEICSDANTCEPAPECVVDDDCSGGTPFCTAGVCVCGAHEDCGVGQYCDDSGACGSCEETNALACGTAASVGGCEICSGDTPVCTGGACVCGSHDDCGPGRFCDDNGACGSCGETNPLSCGTASSIAGCEVCSGDTPVCSGGACVCGAHADCGEGRYCDDSGVCGLCEETNHDYCGTASTKPGCYRCLELRPLCSGGACGSCAVANENSSVDGCGLGHFCGDTGACETCEATNRDRCGTALTAAGCEICSGATPACVDGACTKCTEHTQCPGGHSCTDGYCIDREWVQWPIPKDKRNRAIYTPSDSGMTVSDGVTGLSWQYGSGANATKWDNAKAYCANLVVGENADWRLPTAIELQTILDFAFNNPGIDEEVFAVPSSVDNRFWTSSRSKTPGYSWNVTFNNFGVAHLSRSSFAWTRCVRGGKVATASDRFVLYVDSNCGGEGDPCPFEKVVDNVTNLMWQRKMSPREYTWSDSVDYCEGLDSGALANWRLPTVKELRSLVDVRAVNPAIDTAAFPEVKDEWFWTSSIAVQNVLQLAQVVEFETGHTHSTDIKSRITNRIRCVRGN